MERLGPSQTSTGALGSVMGQLRGGWLGCWGIVVGAGEGNFEDGAGGVGAVAGEDEAAVFADDAFGDGEAEAGAAGIEAGGGEGFEESREDGGVDAGAVVDDADGDPFAGVAGGGAGDDADAGVFGVAGGGAAFGGFGGVADEVDEDLDEAVGVAGEFELVADVEGDVDAGGFAVEGDEGGGFAEDSGDGAVDEAGRADACEVEEAFAEAFDAADDAAEEGGLGGIDGAAAGVEAFGEAFDDGEGGVEFVGDAGGHHAEAGEAVGVGEVSAGGFEEVVFAFEVVGDFFEALEGDGEFLAAGAEFEDGLVAGAHDLAEFIAGDVLWVDEFVFGAAFLDGEVGVEHSADGGVDVGREDEAFEGDGDEGVDGEEGDKEDEVEAPDGVAGFSDGDAEADVAFGAGAGGGLVGDGEGAEDGALAEDGAAGEGGGAGLGCAVEAEIAGGAGEDVDLRGEVRVEGVAADFALDAREAGDEDVEHELGFVEFGAADDVGDGGAEGEEEDAAEGEGEAGVEDDELFADAHAREDAALAGVGSPEEDAAAVDGWGRVVLGGWGATEGPGGGDPFVIRRARLALCHLHQGIQAVGPMTTSADPDPRDRGRRGRVGRDLVRLDLVRAGRGRLGLGRGPGVRGPSGDRRGMRRLRMRRGMRRIRDWRSRWSAFRSCRLMGRGRWS